MNNMCNCLCVCVVFMRIKGFINYQLVCISRPINGSPFRVCVRVCYA